MNAMTPNPLDQVARGDDNGGWPTRVSELTDAEMLVLGAYRHWLTGVSHNRPLHFEIVSRELRMALGNRDGEAAFASFAATVRVLARGLPRRIGFLAPCCGQIGLAEAQIIAMVSACQHERLLLAKSVASWLVDPTHAGDLLGRLSLVGSLLKNHGLTLPDRAKSHNTMMTPLRSEFDTVH